MKQHIKQLVKKALEQLAEDLQWPPVASDQIQIQTTRDKQFGDYACNIALLLAKPMQSKPRDLADQLVNALPVSEKITAVSIAGPGFINFTLSDTALHEVIEEVLTAGDDYGHSQKGEGQTVNVEFVSANPTGPLHVGHGRGVAYGAACANLLAAVGYHVHREYYVNDAGRQMDILATSIWLRYLIRCGETLPFPQNGYRGDYIQDIADQLHQQHQDAFHWPAAEVLQGLPEDESQNEQGETQGDKEAYIDALIAKAKTLLGETGYLTVLELGLENILGDIKQDLAEFGVTYENWFSERQLFKDNAVPQLINALKEKGHTYERDGHLWFRATDFGDDKDRVLIRQNGNPTYFASDIAYHVNKLERGADHLIDVLGADHHGYVARVRAALKALDIPEEKLTVLLVQFAVLYRGDEKVQMSTRSGEFITLRQLREEVGQDAARFFYVSRKADQHLDFDLELAKSQTNENPVYYIQYAHARISSVFRQLNEKQLSWNKALGLSQLGLLLAPHEKTLIEQLAHYPELLQAAACNYEPHLLVHYLKDLAAAFHTYYNAQQFIVDDENLRNARFCLIRACQQVIANGLQLLGVSAPDEM